MKRAAVPTHPVKQEVITIDDDEPSSEQPVVKNVKVEERPSPALSVAELQEKLKKSEEKCQRAIRIAGEHLARVEQLEGLIDKKHDVSLDAMEELQKKVGELTNELEVERQRGNEERRRDGVRIANLTSQVEEERRRGIEGRNILYERINVLTDELEMDRRRAQFPAMNQRQFGFAPENRAYEMHLRDRARIDDLEREVFMLKEDLAYANMDREHGHRRIHELTAKLAWLEGGQNHPAPPPIQQHIQHVHQQQPAAEGGLDPSDRGPMQPLHQLQHIISSELLAAKIAKTPHVSNILQLLHSDSMGYISLDAALTQLERASQSCDMKKFHDFCISDTRSSFDCDACEKTYSKWELLQHFFSDEHIGNVRASGAGVSELAVKQWLSWLQKVPPVAASAATVAAAAASDDSSVFSGVAQIA